METAIDNLNILSKEKNFLNDIIIENDKLIEINEELKKDDNDFDLMNTLKDYKYPILITFEKIFFFIEYSNIFKYKNYTKDDLMILCDSSIDNLYKIYNNLNIESNDKNVDDDFYLMIEFISDQFNQISEYRDNYFLRIKESILYFYNNVSEAYVESKRYLYFSNNLTITIDEKEGKFLDDNQNEELDELDEPGDGSDGESGDRSDGESGEESRDESGEESRDESGEESRDESDEELDKDLIDQGV